MFIPRHLGIEKNILIDQYGMGESIALVWVRADSS